MAKKTLKELSPVAQAYARSKQGRDLLFKVARCMEVTEDSCGIVWERWLMPDCTSVLLFATPHMWDVFRPVSDSPNVDKTLEAIVDLSVRQGPKE